AGGRRLAIPAERRGARVDRDAGRPDGATVAAARPEAVAVERGRRNVVEPEVDARSHAVDVAAGGVQHSDVPIEVARVPKAAGDQGDERFALRDVDLIGRRWIQGHAG